jgi:hypothetical protein
MTATRAPSPTPSLTPEEVDRRRHAAFARSPVNRLANRVLARLVRLREDIEELAEANPGELTAAWIAAGLPVLGDDDGDDGYGALAAVELLNAVEDMAGDAAGFLWALGAFVGVLESHTVPVGTRGGRRRGRR